MPLKYGSLRLLVGQFRDIECPEILFYRRILRYSPSGKRVPTGGHLLQLRGQALVLGFQTGQLIADAGEWRHSNRMVKLADTSTVGGRGGRTSAGCNCRTLVADWATARSGKCIPRTFLDQRPIACPESGKSSFGFVGLPALCAPVELLLECGDNSSELLSHWSTSRRRGWPLTWSSDSGCRTKEANDRNRRNIKKR